MSDEAKLYTIDIGFTKFELPIQSILAYALAVFIFLLIAIIQIFPMRKMLSTASMTFIILLLSILIIGYGILAAYVVKCIIYGKCIKLSWVIIVFFILVNVVHLAKAVSVLNGTPVTSSLKKSGR